MSEFKKGDVVRMKSGGPKMTIATVDAGGAFFCQWFDEKKIQQQGTYDGATLELVGPSSGVRPLQS